MRAWLSLLLLAGCGRLSFDLAPNDVGLAGDVGLGGDDAITPVGFSHVVARRTYTCAIYEGSAYCWGGNGEGQLGDGTMTDRAVPTRVQLPPGTLEVLNIGEYAGCAIVDGSLYCWGEMFQPTPTLVDLPASATSVALGKDFVCAIAGETYCWGTNTVGQLGNGTLTPRADPTPVLGSAHQQLYAGEDHICALRVAGGAECWGHNDGGVLGFGSFMPNIASLPQPVDPVITTLPRIGSLSACALEGTTVLCWGTNDDGELGNATGMDSATPLLVSGLPPAAAITTGGSPSNSDCSCAIDFTGAIRCWGFDNSGRLGNGVIGSSPMPVDVLGLPGPAVQTAVGEFHVCAALADGDVWCWGRGTSGQLGAGTMTSSLMPVRVTPPGS